MLRVVRIWVVLVAASSSAFLFAQQGGILLGTVTDPSGAPVAGINVQINNVDTGASLTVSTAQGGDYTSPNIPVGHYRIVVDHPGFKSLVRSGIVIQVDERAEVNLQLTVGSVQEKVEVTGDAPLVDTASGTIGDVIENKRISELPLNGRNALALMFLAPNVKSGAGATNSGFADRGIALSEVSINGGPLSINNFLLDGGNNNQSFVQDLNVNPTVDAIQEFKVQSGVMSAEFGFTLGGVVNIVSKSGTNDFHGTAYEFVRNNDFDARNTFAATVTPYHYNQYGGAIGGPLGIPKVYNGRNRTFFFFNIEEWQYNFANSIITSVPIAAQRTGDFSGLLNATGGLIPIYDPKTTKVNPNGSGYVRTAFVGNQIPITSLDAVALNYLKFVPLPNRPPTNAFTNANNFIGPSPAALHMEQYLTKVDHHFSEKNSLFVRFMYYNEFNDNGGGQIYTDPRLSRRYDNLEARNAIVGDTHSFSPTLFNDFRIGAARNYFPFQAASYKSGIVSQLGLPPSVPDLELPIFSGTGLPGVADGSVGVRGQTTWQLTDTVTWILGTHSLKVGYDGRLQQANNYQPSGLSGSYTFNSTLTGNPLTPSGTGSGLASFLLGDVASATATTALGESEKGFSHSAFIQDDWRVSRRVTINLGLRYDYQPWATERNNGLSNFDPSSLNPLNGLRGKYAYAGQDFIGSPLGGTPPLSFSPRAGFAWDIFGTGKTVFRGGFGIYYENVFQRDFFGNTAGFANTTTTYSPAGNNLNFPAFQLSQGLPSPPIQPLGKGLGPSAFLGQTATYDQSSESVPKSQQWNLSLQKQLPGQWLVEIAYSGNHSDHLIAGGYDLNQLTPAQYATYGNALQGLVSNPYAGLVPGSLGASTITLSQSLKQFPYYTAVNVRDPHLGDSIYHSGLLSVQKHLSNGLVLLASYTKAKLISNSVSIPVNFGGALEGNATITGYQNGLYNRSAERSIDPTDVAQRFVLSGVYELPIGKGKFLNISNGFLNAVIGGWQTQGILTIQSGLPLNITGANNNLATRPNSTGQSAKLSDPTQYEWFNTSVFVNPANYTYGNVSRTLPDVRGPGAVNVDLSLIKSFHIWERFSVQLRGEAFNVANHVNLGMPNTSFSPGTNGLNTSSTFGTITTASAARIVQLGAKVVF
jgi:hypothetical protein